MLSLRLEHGWVSVSGDSRELALLRQHLRVRVKDWYFVTKHRPGWDGYVEFLHNRKFSGGLLTHVDRWLVEQGIETRGTKVFSQATPELNYAVRPDCLQGVTLTRDQMEMLRRWINNDCRGLVWAAPGFGKTEVAAGAIKTLLDGGFTQRVLFLVNGLDLLLQTADRLTLRLRRPVGRIAGGEWSKKEQIVVATIQLFHKIIRDKKKDPERFGDLAWLFKTTGFVIVDEAHHSRATQMRDVLNLLPVTAYRLGLSASPFHKYGRLLLDMTAEDVQVLEQVGPVLGHIKASYQMATGKASLLSLYLYPFRGPELEQNELVRYKLTWAETVREFLVNNELIHEKIIQLVRAAAGAGQTTLVIVGNRIGYGDVLERKLRDVGINAVHLHGTVDREVREATRQDLIANNVECVLATTIYDEGIDLPNLRQLILAYGGVSSIKIQQRVGRALRRKATGENRAVVVDFVNYENEHLRNHTYERMREYLAEPLFDLHLVGTAKDHSSRALRLLGERASLSPPPDLELFRELGRRGSDRTKI